MAKHNIVNILEGGSFGSAPGKELMGGLVKYPSGLWAKCPMVYAPSHALRIVEDFEKPWVTTEWTITTVEAGSSSATEATSDAQGGVLVLTNDAADDDADQIQYVNEVFKFTAGNPLWFEARAKLSVTTNVDMAIGLIAAEDLTAVADNMPADGCVWKKDDGDTNLDFASCKNGTNDTTNALGTLDTNWHKYGFYFDGDGTIRFYLDGVGVGVAVTTLCDDEELAFFAMVRNGVITVQTALSIDYFAGVQVLLR